MYDHERSLVQRMSGKPFALVGVNTDSDLETIRNTIREKRLIWRSFYDGEGGPIVRQYKIRGFPTVLLLDHKGVVRHVFSPVRLRELDEAIDALVAEAR